MEAETQLRNEERRRTGLLIHLVNQASYAMAEAEDLARAVERGELESAFRHVQNLLMACANMSKVAWPGGNEPKDEKRRAERAPLRGLLGLEESSPLLCRRVRNALEHMDEKIDDWAMKGASGMWLDLNWGPTQPSCPPQKAHLHGHFRYFDLDQGIVQFGEIPTAIGPLLDEVRRVWDTAARLLGPLYVGVEQWRSNGMHSVRIGMSNAKLSFCQEYAEALRRRWGLVAESRGAGPAESLPGTEE